jgi:hypothetical protein
LRLLDISLALRERAKVRVTRADYKHEIILPTFAIAMLAFINPVAARHIRSHLSSAKNRRGTDDLG